VHSDQPAGLPADALTEQERDVIRFEHDFHVVRAAERRIGGEYENEIRARFGVTLTRYVQVLNRMLADPQDDDSRVALALAYDAPKVMVLRRQREARLNAHRGHQARVNPGYAARFTS
jgi:hypothetical protein